jgi:hypothetical protein
VVVTFPHAKVLGLLAVAALLATVAAMLLAISAGREKSSPGARSTVAVSTGTATPGSTASARNRYRISLGR